MIDGRVWWLMRSMNRDIQLLCTNLLLAVGLVACAADDDDDDDGASGPASSPADSGSADSEAEGDTSAADDDTTDGGESGASVDCGAVPDECTRFVDAVFACAPGLGEIDRIEMTDECTCMINDPSHSAECTDAIITFFDCNTENACLPDAETDPLCDDDPVFEVCGDLDDEEE